MLTWGEDYFRQQNARENGRVNADSESGYDDYSELDAPSKEAVDACVEAIQPDKDATVIEIGCAYGYTVRQMLARGLDCVGLDISAVVTERKLNDKINQGDAREHNFSSYSHVVGFNILSCFSDAELTALIPRLNSSLSRNFFQIDDALEWNPDAIRAEALRHYNLKTLDDWRRLPWKRGTTLRAWRSGAQVTV